LLIEPINNGHHKTATTDILPSFAKLFDTPHKGILASTTTTLLQKL